MVHAKELEESGMPMNDVQSLINQQTGFSKWRQSDAPIKRLRCSKKDSYTHLLSQREDSVLYRDTPIFTCKFSPQQNHEHLLALANEDGKLAVHDSNTDERYGIHAHNNAIFDLAWMFNQMKLVTASGDHTSKLYDIGNGEIREEKVFCGHTRSVKTVAFRKDDTSVFATGGRDGNIIVWDTRTDINSFVGRADRTISNSHTAKIFTPTKSRRKFSSPTPSSVKSVTGLAFQGNNTLISCGAGDGIIKIWDLRKNYTTYKKEAAPKSVIPYPGNTTKNGYSSLIIDNEGIRIYANCLDNTIYCYNVATYPTEPVMRYRGHQNSTFYVKSSLGRDGEYLISGSSDENAYIWSTKHSLPLVKLSGHTAEVTCVAWSDKNFVLITCSDDMTHKIWTIGPEELPDDWDVNGRGCAEVVPIVKNTERNFTLKRILEEVEVSTPKRMLLQCERCSGVFTTSCKSCPSSKRKSDTKLDNENVATHTEFGPKRLFVNSTNVATTNENETESSATAMSKTSDFNEYEPPCKMSRIGDFEMPNNHKVIIEDISEDTGCVPLSVIKDDSNQQTRLNRDMNDDMDYEPPAKCPRNNIENSPTVNLPNYIVDGVAPHLNYSPPKKKNHDWLTRLRIENQLRRYVLVAFYFLRYK
ncbi:unnamed protein product [Acanthoscelides obtectus]|uniref:Anaphase-promoting complex subunit 4-like WD40 domain-containing protein n=1 Tax=Acanthoscelides obtectus TaxID=200917 RepID=A0A9P0PGF8_ACAOB|nr:unnamed protein product [Acanthoscelides obtectus]CAK1626306.1 Protein lethal(2)denticleless [Acanthoscelides obtectus]